MMKEDPGVSNAQAWGCPCAPPINIQGDSASKLGDAPVHPLLHQQLSVRPSFHYIFITSCVMCYAWNVSLFTFLGFLCFVCCSNKLDPSLLFCVGEIHAPLELELLIGIACLFSFSSELFFFLVAATSLVFLEVFFCLRLNFL